MSNFFAKIIPSEIDKNKARDTGMAMVLILLILELIYQNNIYYKIAMAALVVDMIAPLFFKPLGYVWFGLAHLIGTIVSSILLFLIYMLIVFPVALFRRMLGKDPLRLKEWKTGTGSVFRLRNYSFKAGDIEKPY